MVVSIANVVTISVLIEAAVNIVGILILAILKLLLCNAFP